MTEINPVQSQAPSLPPVTKEETDSFFQRLATNFVRMSNQDRELQNMRYDLQRLNARLDEYVEENSKLKNEITTAYELMKSIEQERDSAKRDLADEQAATVHLREQTNMLSDTLVQRDHRIAELEWQVSELQTSNRQVQSERDSFQGNRDYWQRRAAEFEDKLHHTEQDRSGWVDRTNKAEASRDKLQTRLDQMKAIISPPEDEDKPSTHEPPTTREHLPF